MIGSRTSLKRALAGKARRLAPLLIAGCLLGAATAQPGPAPSGGSDALAHGQAVARFAAAFNEAVAAAAAAGASWPSDPIRVALAFVDLLGAPSAIISRSDVGGGESATETVITIVEDGLLDDSVAGMQQTVTLRLSNGVWSVTSYAGAWLCRRPPGSTVALPGVCL